MFKLHLQKYLYQVKRLLLQIYLKQCEIAL